MLLGERLDATARRIHERYVADATARGEQMGARRSLCPWLLLPEDLKDDNRHLAEHHFVKLREVGCVALERKDGIVDPGWSAEEIEALARMEHNRWVANRQLTGWQYAAQRDDSPHGRLIRDQMTPDETPCRVAMHAQQRLDIARTFVDVVHPHATQIEPMRLKRVFVSKAVAGKKFVHPRLQHVKQYGENLVAAANR